MRDKDLKSGQLLGPNAQLPPQAGQSFEEWAHLRFLSYTYFSSIGVTCDLSIGSGPKEKRVADFLKVKFWLELDQYVGDNNSRLSCCTLETPFFNNQFHLALKDDLNHLTSFHHSSSVGFFFFFFGLKKLVIFLIRKLNLIYNRKKKFPDLFVKKLPNFIRKENHYFSWFWLNYVPNTKHEQRIKWPKPWYEPITCLLYLNEHSYRGFLFWWNFCQILI